VWCFQTVPKIKMYIIVVGTLNQGYPLLQHEDAVPTRLSLVTCQTAPDSSTWMAPGSPCGQRKRYTPRCQQWVRTPMGKYRTPVHVDRTSGARSRTPARATRTSRSGPGPLCVGSRLLSVGPQDSEAENT
jgi:hypothetical protein